MVTNVALCFLALFRFHVLSKLLSFMAPIDHTEMNDDARWAAVLVCLRCLIVMVTASQWHHSKVYHLCFLPWLLWSPIRPHKSQHHLWGLALLSIHPLAGSSAALRAEAEAVCAVCVALSLHSCKEGTRPLRLLKLLLGITDFFVLYKRNMCS